MDFIKDNSYLEAIKKEKLSKNRNLQKQIYKFLLSLITRGILKDNTLLSESSISQAFNVSKTPVREALKKLETDELIKIMPFSKTYVLPVNIQSANSSYKIRNALEVLIVQEAINNIKESDYEVFENLIKKQKEALDNKNFDSFFEYDIAFHFQIAKVANLLNAWNILKKVNLHINRISFLAKFDYERNIEVIDEHISIFKAIKNKDIVKATYNMEHHLSGASNFLEKLLLTKKLKR